MRMPLLPRRWADTLPDEWKRIGRDTAPLALTAPSVVAEFEEHVARFAGVPSAAALASGRQGMRLILEHIGVGPGHEVIVPAYTLKDLIPLVQGTGAAVIPADVDLRTLNVTPESVRARYTPRTRAVIVLHAFGNPAPVDIIAAEADARGVAVVEDCAHSLGATLKGRQTGSFGYAGFYSFEPTKPVNTYGGGMVVSHDPDLVRFIREKTAHCRHDPSVFLQKAAASRKERLMMRAALAWPVLALMSFPAVKDWVSRAYRSRQAVPPGDLRYTAMQAVLGTLKLETLPARLERRRALAGLLRSLLRPEIRLQEELEGAASAWYFCVALLPGRAAPVRTRLLLRHWVDAAVEDEIADECALYLNRADCPNVVDLYPHALAVPFFDGITEAQIARVARALNAAAGR